MAAASRTTYLGAAIFAVAAVAATLVILPSMSVDLGRENAPATKILPLTMMGSAAGISAALAFWALDRLGWRLRRSAFLMRTTVLGSSTVVASHFLFGAVIALLWSFESAVTSGVILNGDIVLVALAAGAWSFYFLPVTLPLGIAAAVFVEWLEGRSGTDTSKTSE